MRERRPYIHLGVTHHNQATEILGFGDYTEMPSVLNIKEER